MIVKLVRARRLATTGSSAQAVECYDLVQDRLEQRPIPIGQAPTEAQVLYRELLDRLRRLPERPAETDTPAPLAPEVEEGLRALGYLEG